MLNLAISLVALPIEISHVAFLITVLLECGMGLEIMFIFYVLALVNFEIVPIFQ